jgi:hypothetical protein
MSIMSYFQTYYNNTRYIVFIQTKYHQNLLPEFDVSPGSLRALLITIWRYKWGAFRSIRIYKEHITSLRIYERNFINYKANVLKLSPSWNKRYENVNNLSFLNINKFLVLILDLYLYNFVFWKEINKFWKTITNSKPKYLIDVSEEALKLMYWSRMEYSKNSEWKEVIKHIDFHDWKLIINEEIFDNLEGKSEYFLKLLSDYFDKESTTFISIFEYIDLYENNVSEDWKDFDYLNLNKNNIKNSYIETINKNVAKKYDRWVFEVKEDNIQLIESE